MPKTDPASYPGRVIPDPQRPGTDQAGIFATSTGSQLWQHIKTSNMPQWSLLWCGLTTQPLLLKADSKVTVVIGIAKISLAIQANIGYLCVFVFHQLKILISHTLAQEFYKINKSIKVVFNYRPLLLLHKMTKSWFTCELWQWEKLII